MIWIVAAMFVACLLALVLLRPRNNQSGRLADAIVMLRAETRDLTEADVRAAARRAWDGEPHVRPMQASDSGYSLGVVAKSGHAFMVLVSSRPVCDDPEVDSRKFEDAGVREAFRAHRAWISVNCVGFAPPDSVQVMGCLASELIDDGCILLYAPAIRTFALPSPETVSYLREGNFSALFEAGRGVPEPITQTQLEGA
jgi:hypothetical protein